MSLYGRYVLPRLIHLACSNPAVTRQRRKVVPLARGRVLEVGIGSGLNLPFYDGGGVERIWGLEPAPELRRMALRAAADTEIEVELIDFAEGGGYPLDRGSVDTAVITYTLCSIADPVAALREVARVLKSGGELIFCEHGLAPDAGVRRMQGLVNPVWKLFSGGCHLDRDIPELLARGGFEVHRLEQAYTPGWRPGSFNYWGAAGRG